MKIKLCKCEGKMRYCEENGKIELTGVADFEPEKIFECGQCFRWNRQNDGAYLGVVGDRVARVWRENESIFISGTMADFESIWVHYFDLDKDYSVIRKQVSVNEYMRKATDFGTGIRILRQDRWEALCSFLLSQCNNITRIKKIVETLCAHFGEPIFFEEKRYYSFPSAERIASLTLGDLEILRCGYRAPYLISAARAVTEGAVDLDALAEGSPKAAREALCRLAGVGEKVANCVLLFGLQKLDAFPVDVWIRRAITSADNQIDPSIFGEYAGIAQQYIFYYARCAGNTGKSIKNAV